VEYPGSHNSGSQEIRIGAAFMPHHFRSGIQITRQARGYSQVNGHKKAQTIIGSRHNFLFFGYLFAAFAFAHRARCAAAIFFRAATDIVRLLGIATTFVLLPFDLAFAHRAFCEKCPDLRGRGNGDVHMFPSLALGSTAPRRI
jgi:hypothetical protein